MVWILILIVLLTILSFMIAVILFSKLKITIIGCLVDNQFDGRIDFSLFNVKIISKRSGEKRKNQNGVFSLFKNRAGFYSSLKKYKMTLLKIKADVGLDDAAFTAISTGIIYSVMSWIYAVLNNYIEIEKVNFDVVPDFSQSRFEFEFTCIIEVKVVNIIIDVLHVWADSVREKIKNSERESLYG